MERRLAAIMAADLVGYSRRMERDEAGTLAELKTLLSGIFEPTIDAHRGRIIKLMGDGILAEFPSVLAAATCATKIQNLIAEHNAGRDPEAEIQYRIGINLGDVIIDGDDIYGDGVNVAARIEALTPPGEV